MPATRGHSENSGEPDLRRAETKSLALLQQFSVDTPAFDIEVLARVMDIEVREGGLEKADAWLIRRPEGKGILRVNSNVRSEARRRFSIAHELGHWEMHPDLTQGRYCTETDLTDYHRSPEEIEANTFAASLLMPRFLVRDRIGNVDPCFAVIDSIADEFETSRTATARRLVELTKYKVILVATSQGRVDWSLKSEPAKYHGLHNKTVPSASATARVVAEQSSTPSHEPMSPRVWLRDNPVWNPEELFEDVRYFSRFDTALTLLWFL